jgi:hypothetical protein
MRTNAGLEKKAALSGESRIHYTAVMYGLKAVPFRQGSFPQAGIRALYKTECFRKLLVKQEGPEHIAGCADNILMTI